MRRPARCSVDAMQQFQRPVTGLQHERATVTIAERQLPIAGRARELQRCPSFLVIQWLGRGPMTELVPMQIALIVQSLARREDPGQTCRIAEN